MPDSRREITAVEMRAMLDLPTLNLPRVGVRQTDPDGRIAWPDENEDDTLHYVQAALDRVNPNAAQEPDREGPPDFWTQVDLLRAELVKTNAQLQACQEEIRILSRQVHSVYEDLETHKVGNESDPRGVSRPYRETAYDAYRRSLSGINSMVNQTVDWQGSVSHQNLGAPIVRTPGESR